MLLLLDYINALLEYIKKNFLLWILQNLKKKLVERSASKSRCMPAVDDFFIKDYLKHKNQRDLDSIRVQLCPELKLLIFTQK